MRNRQTRLSARFTSIATFAATISVALLAAGCGGGGGGGSDDVTVTTGGNGSLNAVGVSPTPGSVYIGKATSFLVSWEGSGSEPPAQFTTSLAHYREPIGGEPREVDTQKINVTQSGSASWAIKRKDNFDLDGGGVYILNLSAPGGQQALSTFIVGNDRSFPASDQTRSASDSPGTGGSLSGLQISPAPGSTYISRNTTFQLSWNGATPPPSQFQAALWRYKEARGSDSGGVSEQKVYLSRQGSSYTWNFGRTDNFSLDGSGAYYIEVTDKTTGALYRAAYIVSGDN